MSRNRVISAIDVGSSKVSTIIGQIVDNQEKINIIGVSSIPSTGVKKGQIVDINLAADSIVKSVEAAERMAGCQVNRISVTVGGAHISSQNSHGVVAVSNTEGEIIEEDVRRVVEAARAISIPSTREILHVIPRKYTVDTQEEIVDPVGMCGTRLEIETHIITGSTTAIKNLSRCISEVGAEINEWVFSGLASSKAVLSDTDKDLGVILIDIGGGTTSVVVFNEGSPIYSTVLPVGAINVTKDLATGLRLSSLESAEKVKVALSNESRRFSSRGDSSIKTKEEKEKEDEFNLAELGIEEDTRKVSKKTLNEGIVKPRMCEIFSLVLLDLQKNGFDGLSPSGVVLTGGGSLTIGAVDVCKRILSLPARIGYPARVSGLVDDILDPAFSAPIGLLLRQVEKDIDIKNSSSGSRFSSVASKIPVKGIVGKMTTFFKKFLP